MKHRQTWVPFAVIILAAGSYGAAAQDRAIRADGATVILHPAGRWEIVLAPSAAAEAASETLTTANVFFGNLHSHTSYSDGSGTPADAYLHARDVAGLDFLAITEHNHRNAPSDIARDHTLYNGAQDSSLISTAGRFNEAGRFVALYGQEFSSISSGNHANVLDVRDVIDEADVPNGRWDNLLGNWLPSHKDSEGQRAVMLLNHPAQSSSPNAKEYGIDDFPTAAAWRDSLDPHAELINVVNGPSHDDSAPGRPSESEFLRYLNLGLHVAPTADQDNHRLNWGSAAPTRTGVWAPALTKHDLLTALRGRHVYATEDQNLRIVGTVNGALMGTRFVGSSVPAPGTALDIELSFLDEDEPGAIYTIDVFRDVVGGTAEADVVRQQVQEGNGTAIIAGVTYSGGNEYVFVKVTQRDDDDEIDRAWLAPVWFEPAGEPEDPPPPPGVSLVLAVNVAAEEATITNVEDAPVNLMNWVLVSVVGNQRFTFTSSLDLVHGGSVVVTSGPSAKTGPGFLKWTGDYVWRNAGDPGQLLDPTGAIRAEAP